MIDRQIWRGLVATSVTAAARVRSGHRFRRLPAEHRDLGRDPDRSERHLARREPHRVPPWPDATFRRRPRRRRAPRAAGTAPFSVGYIFTIEHLPTAEAQKLRDADKAKKQEAVEKATKILAEEQRKAAADPKPVASGETPIEPKVLSYGIPRAPDSVVDLHDEVTVTSHRRRPAEEHPGRDRRRQQGRKAVGAVGEGAGDAESGMEGA